MTAGTAPRDDARLGHHREREPAREAHADGAHTATAAFGMSLSGERPEPFDDLTRFAAEPDIELPVDADGRHDRNA
jgi:hypothetical protein